VVDEDFEVPRLKQRRHKVCSKYRRLIKNKWEWHWFVLFYMCSSHCRFQPWNLSGSQPAL